MTPLFISRW